MRLFSFTFKTKLHCLLTERRKRREETVQAIIQDQSPSTMPVTAKRPLFIDRSVDSELIPGIGNIQDSNATEIPAEGENRNVLEKYADETMHEQSINWENEVVFCLELQQSKLGISLLDINQETLSVLNQDIIVNARSSENMNEVNLILENLILENEPSVVLCSSRLGEVIYENLKFLSIERSFRLQMQSHDKFKVEYFVQHWNNFQESQQLIDIQGFQILDQLGTNKAAKVTTMSLSCLIKSMDHFSAVDFDECEMFNFFEKVNIVRQLMLKDRLFLDDDTLAALHIFKPIQIPGHFCEITKTGYSSVFDLLNHTTSELGKRLLKSWLASPLSNKILIEERQKVIRSLIDGKNAILFDDLSNSLKYMPNIFSIVNEMSKGAVKLSVWRKYISFCTKTVEIINLIHILYDSSDNCRLFNTIKNDLDKSMMLKILKKTESVLDLEGSLNQDAIVIKDKVRIELDEARGTYFELEGVLNLVANEANNTLISTLQSNEEKLFKKLNGRNALINAIYLPQLGYLLCVDASIEDMFDPAVLYWTEIFREQNVIYYKNDDTKVMDEHYGDLHGIISDLELEILLELQNAVLNTKPAILLSGKCFAELEVLVSFAKTAISQNYVQPVIEEKECVIEIENGRHPLYETLVDTYIPNDLRMLGGTFDNDTWNNNFKRISVITGANASGKSVFLTQNGLIVFLAHIGCFVPADNARIGLVDKILTRVVTRESVAKTQSTFEIDANQMSKCLSLATPRSLLLIDEFGKGTDVIDGLSMFGAIIKDFSRSSSCPRVIASTHYNEVFSPNILTSEINGVVFYKTEILLQVMEKENKGNARDEMITFLYKLSTGIATNSFGIFCAKNCGLRQSIVQRAQELTTQIADGFDIAKNYSKLTIEELNQFRIDQDIAKEFVAWDLDLESIHSDKIQHAIRRKLQRILDAGQSC
ncbi:MutS family protein MSH5 [Kluyveromyces lactis]|uniref:KLLA0C16423p n=1 Tax=Kluyveromyces lactis (strain ATCC 8585 / CBS 2359 / DSM 70799 / NBRC 1267 / NRRL Y-1140 / WM37) TaxID=284590 RepID=Q6CT05_KLULA|nr:uncharacterized protein KLLA0_C16423g [Kluyveromyces lactis]CAH01785.1 KLLA0C16423p [Kluyveromyces lactis]|eukprot:XP_452934.1 uncharacterized protein KLLA0_C16423g [Kluyveromyces lactis]